MRTTIAIGVILAILRIWIGYVVPPEHITLVDLFKDTAHLFIGGLGAAWWYARKPWQWDLFWTLNAVEVSVAVWSRMI